MTLSRIFHWVAVAFLFFVLLSPAILFFLWMLSLSLKFEIDNGPIRRSSSLSALRGRTTPRSSRRTISSAIS